MKLLHIGLMVSGTKPYAGLERELNLITDYLSLTLKTPQPEMIRIAQEFKPDIIFMQIQRANVIDLETFEALSKIGKVINWTGDVRTPIPQWYINAAPYCITAFSNNTDVKEMSDYEGLDVKFLQIGFDPKVFYPKVVEKDIDIIFMGNNYTSAKFPLSGMRIDMVEKLKAKYGDRFKLYGSGWHNSDGSCNGNQAEENELYNRSKVAINLSHFDYENYSSDRMYRLMGSGAFCLSHKYKGIEEDFDIARQLDVWSDFNELTEKIDYYLTNEIERRAKAYFGYDYVCNTYSYKQMAENILKL